MKIVHAHEMGRIEHLAYDSGASEEGFMNRAGEGVAECLQQYIGQMHLRPRVAFLCGRGNNAGDAYVAARILHQGGFHVRALALASFEDSSPLCQLQSQRYTGAGGIIQYVKEGHEIDFEEMALIVDGILGTGFHGPVAGLFREAIERANASKLPIISIDIPSGIDGNTGEIGGVAIQATETLFLGLPKTGCFMGDAWNYVGQIATYDFGLKARYIEEAKSDFTLITDSQIQEILPPIVRNRHKYQTGYVVGLGGSPGMPGAPIMASFATLRAGGGIVRLLHPAGMETELSPAPFEVIRQGFQPGDCESVLAAMGRASATFVGPGIGTSEEALHMLQGVLPKLNVPCVIDAEALTLLAHHSIDLPPQTIMTPHHGEMGRLLGIEGELPMAQLIEKSRAYSEEKKVTLVLKGAPTIIFHPGETPYLCARGDAGMATAGTGDVLTGMIAAFLAQTHDPLRAAILGVQLHALSGEHAASELTSYCLAATDLIEALPSVFHAIVHSKK